MSSRSAMETRSALPRSRYGSPAQVCLVGEPLSLEAAIAWHLADLRVRGYAASTVSGRANDLGRFAGWAEGRSLGHASEITGEAVRAYQYALFSYRRANGRPIGMATQRGYLLAVVVLFRWLCDSGFLADDPTATLRLPAVPRRLPRRVPTIHETLQLLECTSTAEPAGLLERTVLEVLYATGLRRSELPRVDLVDVDLAEAQVFVREGKGARDRVVPLGQRALGWIEEYLSRARGQWAGPSEEALFVDARGQRLRPEAVARIVKRRLRAAGLDRTGSTHLLRHACATHMLENGSDIRFIQSMLGHKSLQSTAIYTHVSMAKLKEVHARSHPSAMSPAKTSKRAIPLKGRL